MTETRTRRRRPEATQQRLLEVAGEIVGEAGVAALTLEAVAKRAGVSRMTIYRAWSDMGSLLGGTVLVEYVFNWPGLSTPLLRAVEARDYPMVVGIVLARAVYFEPGVFSFERVVAWAQGLFAAL